MHKKTCSKELLERCQNTVKKERAAISWLIIEMIYFKIQWFNYLMNFEDQAIIQWMIKNNVTVDLSTTCYLGISESSTFRRKYHWSLIQSNRKRYEPLRFDNLLSIHINRLQSFYIFTKQIEHSRRSDDIKPKSIWALVLAGLWPRFGSVIRKKPNITDSYVYWAILWQTELMKSLKSYHSLKVQLWLW